MLTMLELDEIKHYVLRELPHVLEQDRQFILFVEGIISEKIPRCDEFRRLSDELTATRQEQRQSFQKVDDRFDKVDQRLGGIDQHLGGIDQHLEGIDHRFEGVDQRFDKVDQRFDKVDQRFDKADQRFDKVDQCFEGVDQRLEGLTQEMRDQGAKLTQEMRNLRDWVELIAGRLQTRVGRNLEDIVAGALRLGLSRPDIDPINVRLRQKISDPTGLVYKPGKQKEVDLIAQDGELLVFEVKSAPDVDDVDEFADKVELVRLQNPDRLVIGVFVAVGADADVRQFCTRRGVQLIP